MNRKSSTGTRSENASINNALAGAHWSAGRYEEAFDRKTRLAQYLDEHLFRGSFTCKGLKVR